jgi:hypothetical protein
MQATKQLRRLAVLTATSAAAFLGVNVSSASAAKFEVIFDTANDPFDLPAYDTCLNLAPPRYHEVEEEDGGLSAEAEFPNKRKAKKARRKAKRRAAHIKAATGGLTCGPPKLEKETDTGFSFLGWLLALQGVDPTEVKASGMFQASFSRMAGAGRAVTDPITAIKVVVPPMSATPRQVTNYICPTQLPTAQITTTRTNNDTLMCSGGSLAVGQNFNVNLQTNPAPTKGMGGQISAQQGGAFGPLMLFRGP